ncbi:AAA family ATPase [Escherichia coli]
MRPENLAQYIGQQHLLAAGKPLPRAIEAGHLHSMILWGPPGTGKTTLAEVIARYANADVERISAVTSGVKEIREAIERARRNRNAGRRTILFVDEVHRFNKSQQDAFCHILKTAPSLLLAQPLKTRRLSLIRHCFPVPVFIC